jgi:hypothetical protein
MGNSYSEYLYSTVAPPVLTADQLKSLQDGLVGLRPLPVKHHGYDRFSAIGRDRHCHLLRQSALNKKKKVLTAFVQSGKDDFCYTRKGKKITVASWASRWYTLEHRSKPKITAEVCRKHKKSQLHRLLYTDTGKIPPAPLISLNKYSSNPFGALMITV